MLVSFLIKVIINPKYSAHFAFLHYSQVREISMSSVGIIGYRPSKSFHQYNVHISFLLLIHPSKF